MVQLIPLFYIYTKPEKIPTAEDSILEKRELSNIYAIVPLSATATVGADSFPTVSFDSIL